MYRALLNPVLRLALAGALAAVLLIILLNAPAHQLNAAIAAPSQPLGRRIFRADDPRPGEVVTRPAHLQPGVASIAGGDLPGWVHSIEEQGRAKGAAGGMDYVQAVATGSGDEAVAYNGSRITYTLLITNSGSGDATNIQLVDTLPNNTLDEVRCDEDCVQEVVTTTISGSGPGGWIITRSVTSTSFIRWSLGSLAPGQATRRTFSARVHCQPDGVVFKNNMFGTSTGGSGSDERETIVRVRTEKNGAGHLSSTPSWCSVEPGTNYLDVGDSAGVGSLSLGLSFIGVTAYDNQSGHFVRVEPFQEYYADTVRWSDFDGIGRLDMAATGPYIPQPSGFVGENYLYRDVGGGDYERIDTFVSDDALYRLLAADYSGDGRMDLATSNPWDFLSAGDCKVRLYLNQGGADRFRPYTDTVNTCVLPDGGYGARGLAWGDFDNDGDPDLAAGGSDGVLRLFLNSSGQFSSTQAITIDLFSLAYDMAWGDYDSDGYLDLAAIYPIALQPQVRIYHNTPPGGFNPRDFITIANVSHTGQALDWGDFDGDGRLELAVADDPPRIYEYQKASNRFSAIWTAPEPAIGTVGSIRWFDYDNDGDLDLGFTRSGDAQALLFSSFGSFLSRSLSPVSASKFASLAWGDADDDGQLDLLFGSATDEFGGSRLFRNRGGTFPTSQEYAQNGFGPQAVAFGDMNTDGQLEVAIGVAGQVQVYAAGQTNWPPVWSYLSSATNYSVAWGDADQDRDLDLLVGSSSGCMLFINHGGSLASAPAWECPDAGEVRSVAWADFDGDNYPDIAAGALQNPTRVYRNNKNNSFSLAWSSPVAWNTRSVAWADWDGDGRLDLAVGNYGQPNLIYRNLGSTLSASPAWQSPDSARTTSLAWGDWNNDGRPDLAVGNYDQKAQVFANLSTRGAPQLAWLWTSEESFAATGVAWGDADGDGDMDLAMSQDGSQSSGVFLNNYVLASHQTDNFVTRMPLSNNPSYLSVERPGSTAAAYLYSSSEILAEKRTGTSQVIPVRYTVYDPDGTRDVSKSNQPGDDLAPSAVHYQYSLDGGGTWLNASGRLQAEDSTTRRQGVARTFLWDAGSDHAVSDDAIFRVTIFNRIGALGDGSPAFRCGVNQRATTSALSPPFRVRATSCVWPEKASIDASSTAPVADESVYFFGRITAGTGVLTYTWDFGDGSDPLLGQARSHSYAVAGDYAVTLTVQGEACPVAHTVMANVGVTVRGGKPTPTPDYQTFLPLIQRESQSALGSPGAAATMVGCTLPGCPGQATGLNGTVFVPPTDGAAGGAPIALTWNPNPAADAVTGYRVYRGMPFYLLAELPASASGYTDATAGCGAAYYVTAVNAQGESPPSAASYYGPPCW